MSNDVFSETLELAAESGVKFSGVLCGRATWKDAIPVYAKQGVKALEDWLADQGVKNIENVNEPESRHPLVQRLIRSAAIRCFRRGTACRARDAASPRPSLKLDF